ncbi:cation transporter [Candidatus Thiomargarita nelsonii]|uniref:Cation transporter n=1 Tax=Candidatus Thiomargarita nelsonii TaxID=1003181 RepID=A0A0A6PJL9_9GAMM|nr:cation transporter [Candidatus Thiomargarita nelsonii]
MLKTSHTPQQERYIAIRNVTLIGVVGNILLTIVKLIFGIIGQSQALIADGLHSLSDLISDGMILIAAKYSTQDADADHPYGHARFETLATVAVGVLLFLVAAGMLIDATRRLFDPTLLWQPTAVSLAVALLSILIKEALYQYTSHVAKQVRSPMLQANAWHHRSDAISSIIVLLGVAGSMAGLSGLDALAAIGVSLMIAHIAWSLGRDGIKDLVDTGLDKNQLIEIKNIIKSVDGVQMLHDLRTRKMGANALVDVHILVDPRLSVSEGHQIGEMVRSRLTNKIEEIAEVLVHIDPENDEKSQSNLNLPLRQEVIARLQQCWQCLEATHAIEQITLHYLSGKLTVELYLPLKIVENIEQAQELSQGFADLAAEEPDIYAINVYYR